MENEDDLAISILALLNNSDALGDKCFGPSEGSITWETQLRESLT